MSFRRKVHNGFRMMIFENGGDVIGFGNISADECVPRIRRDLLKVPEIPGVGKLVEVNNLDVLPRLQRTPYKTGPDEAGPARDQNFHWRLRIDAEV
jgi:hypothetical protein